MRGFALGSVGAPSSVAVETGWWAAESSSSSGETCGRTTAGGGVRTPRSSVATAAVVETESVAVVRCAAGRVGENGVGFGEEGECLGGVGGGAVGVRVVSFREGVEGPVCKGLEGNLEEENGDGGDALFYLVGSGIVAYV